MEFECETSSGVVRGQIWGATDQPVIVALHGWLDNSESFRRLAQLLPQYCMVCIDLPGHGKSDWLGAGADYAIWSYLTPVIDVLDHLPLLKDRSYHLVGHSMGGGVAMLLAAVQASRVLSLIFLDCLGPATTAASVMLDQLKNALSAPKIPHRLFRNPDDSLQARLKISPGYTADCLKALVERNLIVRSDGVGRTTDARLKLPSMVRLTHEQLVSVMQGISMPVLVVRAEQGILPKKLLELRLPYIPHARLVTLPGHHHLHLESSTVTAVATHLAGFLGEVGFRV